MNRIDMAKATFNFDDFDTSSQYLSDDFKGTDSVGGPSFDKAGWGGMGQMFKHSMPDIKVVIDDVHEDDDSVMITSRIMGTFSNDFDLTQMGMGVIPAGGKMVEFPAATNKISFSGDKITGFHNTETGPEAGLLGMLKALDVEPGK